ncbi:MAG: flagellar motor switch protein FliN/FliY [Planctomycetota bacterium]|jgi:flagellar motor switch protein FliN/FliY
MSKENIEENVGDGLSEAVAEATAAVAVQANELQNLAEGMSGEPIGLGGVMDVPVKLTVRIGETQISLAQLVDLGPGSLITLDRSAHEPADIFVNGKLVARGEIVTIEEKYAIRVSDITPK